jgi:hypothetical protein
MDDLYAINAAKTEFREGFNLADTFRVLAIADPDLVNFSDGQPSEFGESGLWTKRRPNDGCCVLGTSCLNPGRSRRRKRPRFAEPIKKFISGFVNVQKLDRTLDRAEAGRRPSRKPQERAHLTSSDNVRALLTGTRGGQARLHQLVFLGTPRRQQPHSKNCCG